MKTSELTISFIKDYLRIDSMGEEGNYIVDGELGAMLASAKKYASSYTGLPETATDGELSLDSYDDITFAVLAIVSDMFENRTSNVDKQTYANRTVECILSMHSFNLV